MPNVSHGFENNPIVVKPAVTQLQWGIERHRQNRQRVADFNVLQMNVTSSEWQRYLGAAKFDIADGVWAAIYRKNKQQLTSMRFLSYYDL